MPRFQVDLPLAGTKIVHLPEAVARHAFGALRLRAGETVTLFNGDGAEYWGVLDKAGKSATVTIEKILEPLRESTLDITLVQGISSGERMDYTLQKAVELGVDRIQPVLMRRSVVRLDADKTAKKLRHWQGVVIAACEQCGRNRVPEVLPVLAFADWLRGDGGAADSTRLILDPEAQRRLKDRPAPAGAALLLAGPEGGFDPAERAAALQAGFEGIRLGPRILRTETAAVAAIAAMQALWGDI